MLYIWLVTFSHTQFSQSRYNFQCIFNNEDDIMHLLFFSVWKNANNFQVFVSNCNFPIILELFIRKMENSWNTLKVQVDSLQKLELTIKTLGNTLTQATRSMHWRQFGWKLSFASCYWLRADSRSHYKRANSLTFPFFSHNSCHFDFSFN